jgi:SAM-dependent methyltransferase
VEIGSNTGTQLRCFQELGCRALGVEPAENIASLANDNGVETLNRYFTATTAADIVVRYGRTRCLVARHVFAHIDDLADVLRAVDTLLTEDGVFVIEVPYAVDLVDRNEFDTLYHEHLSYFTIGTLHYLMGRFEMQILDVVHVDVHGGTVVVLVARAGTRPIAARVRSMIDGEHARGADALAYFLAFARRTEHIKLELMRLILDLKRQGLRLAGYGAPAKGNTLLNYCGINSSYLDYIRDSTPTKQGLYLPGTRLRIRSDEYARAHPPDCYLLLAWNYADEILKKEKEFLDAGGRFIVPIPSPALRGRLGKAGRRASESG